MSLFSFVLHLFEMSKRLQYYMYFPVLLVVITRQLILARVDLFSSLSSVGHFSSVGQKKIRYLIKQYRDNVKIHLIFTVLSIVKKS